MNKAAFIMAAPLLACQLAQAACTLRTAYPNTETVPYYMGSGSVEQTPPGAGVELMREIIASAGCTISANSRMPLLRIRAAMEAGTVDAAPMNLSSEGMGKLAFPTNRQGNADPERALRVYFVVFVRAADKIAPDTDPMLFLADKKVGLMLGSSMAAVLRQSGIVVDDGASDMTRNLDKLMRQRVDGYTMSLTNVAEMDDFVARRFGGAIVRLDKPLRVSHVWLATSKQFYAAHQEQVEAMWNWVGANAARRFAELLKKYE